MKQTEATWSEKPVRFRCGRHTAFGILHLPEDSSSLRSSGILFINAGIRSRSGPYRQYVRFAREFCSKGFYVLRFDMPGIGDSEGYFENWGDYRRLVVDNVDMTRDALDFFKSETGIKTVGLLGLCGGAYHSALVGAANRQVDFLVLLSLPTTQLGDISEDTLGPMLLRRYFKKMVQWRSWMRLFLLKSNFRVLGKTVGRISNYQAQGIMVDNSLKLACESYVASGRGALFVYGAKDRFYNEFIGGFGKTLTSLCPDKSSCEIHVVEDADHIFSRLSWQDRVLCKSIDWLQERYGSN